MPKLYKSDAIMPRPPIEIGLSLAVKALAIVALGISPIAIVVFEVLLNFSAMFNHGNFALPNKLEKALRLILVTPDMHRVHHSRLQAETDSNFGFCLSVWDRWFGTYKESSSNDLRADNIGLDEFRKSSDHRVDRLLWQPFVGEPKGH
ncbi:MAG: sterol desaturase family protein [Pseudomonadota bacterium]